MNRDDLEEAFSQAWTVAAIIRTLAQGELEIPHRPSASLYAFLADELDARFERIEVEMEAWKVPAAGSEPLAMPPLTEREIAAEIDITKRLQEAIPLLHQRNLDRAVLLAREAAEGRGMLGEHFAELGRGFELQPEQLKGDAS